MSVHFFPEKNLVDAGFVWIPSEKFHNGYHETEGRNDGWMDGMKEGQIYRTITCGHHVASGMFFYIILLYHYHGMTLSHPSFVISVPCLSCCVFGMYVCMCV